MEGEKGLVGYQNEPRDTYNIAYIIHFVLGAGNLLPWNALITAVDYFGYLYPGKHIDKVFSVAYTGSSLFVLSLLLSWGSWCKKPSMKLRMNIGLSMFALSLMTSPMMDWIWYTGGPQGRSNGAYSLMVVSVAIVGLADGLAAGSLIGSAGKLPKRYMQAVFAGTASSGVLVSILRIITKASLPQNPQGLRTSAHIYFVVSTTIVLGCIVCCNIVDRLPIMQHYKKNQTEVHGNHISQLPEDLPSSTSTQRPKFWDVARKIRWPAFAMLMIYIVTLSIFPGYITEDVVSNLLHDWYPIALITIYNVSDLIGKSFTAVYVLKSIEKASWACMARLLVYPLFTLCLHGPRWLRTEAPVVFLTAVLGLTNGYLTSVLMILVPKSVLVSEAETAGIVMASFLGIGLLGGSIIGWFWII